MRDSNPRAPRRAASFQDWCIQPLYQLSVVSFIGFEIPIQRVFYCRTASSGPSVLPNPLKSLWLVSFHTTSVHMVMTCLSQGHP